MLLRPLRAIADVLTAEDTPSKLAAGFALGMVAGLIPKSSLFAQLALVALSLLTVNLATGYFAVLVFTAASGLLDPLTHAIGSALLRVGFLAPLWTLLYNLPIVPWTGFNNTVILGSTILSLALAYPVYRVFIPIFAHLQERYGPRLKRWRVVRWLQGAQMAQTIRKFK